jgi:hypothetical protein
MLARGTTLARRVTCVHVGALPIRANVISVSIAPLKEARAHSIRRPTTELVPDGGSVAGEANDGRLAFNPF